MRTTSAGLLLAGAILLAGCNPNTTTASPTSSDAAATASTPDAATTSATSEPAAPSAPTTAAKSVPDLVGHGLQDAQDAAQADGFYFLKSHDSLGGGRHQIFDRDWKVCTQAPSAGMRVTVDTTLDFGAVKLTETCP